MAYEATTPVGTVVYETNPIIVWEIDRRDASGLLITSVIDDTLMFEPAVGPSVDLSHRGDIVAKKVFGEVESIVMNIEFTGLSANEQPVMANIAMDELGNIVGAISFQGKQLASLQGHHELLVDWNP